jgi:NAD(P)-dependent dehydrogenase (short-subunit alcohol dehydrogenase family)
MSWTIANIPDLSGKVAVVTGANGGLGFESAKALAGAGVHVVMAARNQTTAQTARNEILAVLPDASLEIVPLDLGSLESVRQAAKTITDTHPAVDILMNNAGVMAMPEGRTVDGFETQLGIDHLGHWVLTARLLPSLLAADAARAVTVTSTAHHYGRAVNPDNPNLEGTYGPWKAYGQAKLANFHFALGLHREFHRRRLATASLSAHPGFSNTNLQAHAVAEGGGGRQAGFWLAWVRRSGMTPADGALPQLRAATDPTARSGEMYAPRFVNNGPPVRRPILRVIGLGRAIDTLWKVSEELTGEKLDIDAALS